MKVKVVSLFLKLVWWATIIISTILLVSCFVGWIKPSTFWVVQLLGLGTLYIFLVELLLLAFWFFVDKKKAKFVGIYVFLLTFFIGLATPFSYQNEATENSIKVTTFNVGGFKGGKSKQSKRELLYQSIQELETDILCLQEFNQSSPSKLDYFKMLKKKGLKHIAFNPVRIAHHKSKAIKYQTGQLIASRYPLKIIYKQGFRQIRETSLNGFLMVEVTKNNQSFCLVNLHLESNKLDGEYLVVKKDRKTLSNWKNNVFSRYKTALLAREKQVEIIKQKMSETDLPIVLVGDFNDPPNSYSHYTLKKNLQDAFIEKGKLIGSTYNDKLPFLRIDNIFCSEKFEVLSFKREAIYFCDHYPISASIELKKP